MKEVNLYLYQCEFCKKQYKNEIDAQNCEKNHKIPNSIENLKYVPYNNDKSGYPEIITMKFMDGSSIRYKKFDLNKS